MHPIRATGTPRPVLRSAPPWRRSSRAGGTRRVEFLDVSGVTLRVAQQGRGRPLLLLSGLGGGIDTWDPLAHHLGGFEIISFDPPGLGGSGLVRFPLGMGGMARLATGVLDRLDRDCVDVLGYSWGGALAQELAYRHPHRVGRLVVCASTCGLGGMPGNPRALARVVRPWGHRSPPSVVYAAQLYAIATWTSLPWLHRLGVPTLVVSGDEDLVVPLANAHLLAGRIPDCRLHVVEGGGHLLLLDQPEEVAPVVHDFLLDPGAGPIARRRRRRLLTLSR